MKNYLFLGLMGTTLFFNSCSSNDDTVNEPAQKKLLLSKITTTYYDNPTKPETSVQNLEYNNQGELIKMQSEDRVSTFEYINGKPSKVNYYNTKQVLEYSTVFYYNADKLVSCKAVYSNPDYNRSSTYTYDSNGRLTSSTFCQSPDCSNPGSETYNYNGDNILTGTRTTGGMLSFTYKSDYSYDDKLSPFTSMNKYLRIMIGGAYILSKNNYLIDKSSHKNSDGSWSPGETTTYSIQYNSSGLPVQVMGKGSDGNLSVQYNYEYITQ
ncbi:hypothetical protein F3J23_03795 [Chryseobacterium sp. Tr-659]|uniref:hypothetical protein n=1 Tax=Chryseobacterium sp. Tr-659 TaxID=2608340 RepID=UPI0014212003|nr:hypothetical protein [Chryseobacterium sp. Tr-659]NIF04555.1 hypothetical protein [Chryseobacterium sp. Tr-659]